MNNMTNWYKELESLAVETISSAKQAANGFDTTIWELPSGKYIASQVGPPMPPGSIRVATRRFRGDRWKPISAADYDAAQKYAAIESAAAEMYE